MTRSPKLIARLWNRLAIPALSGVVALIWLSQFTVSVPLYLIANGLRRSWPIIDYPMYSPSHFEGDQISRLAVVSIRNLSGFGSNYCRRDATGSDVVTTWIQASVFWRVGGTSRFEVQTIACAATVSFSLWAGCPGRHLKS